MIYFYRSDCDPAYCKIPGCRHQDYWEFNSEVYLSQAEVVKEAESYFGLLWGPVPSLLTFVERPIERSEHEKKLRNYYPEKPATLEGNMKAGM